MRGTGFIIGVATALSLAGCRTTEPATETGRNDSLRVEVRTQTIYKTDTITITIPEQKTERSTRDSVSVLDIDFAISEARIAPDGTLTHTLATKRKDLPVVATVPVERTDSIIERSTTITRTVEVEKKLTTWQKFQICGFWILAIALLFVIFITQRESLHKLLKK